MTKMMKMVVRRKTTAKEEVDDCYNGDKNAEYEEKLCDDGDNKAINNDSYDKEEHNNK